MRRLLPALGLLTLAACAVHDAEDARRSESALDVAVTFQEKTSEAFTDQPCGPGAKRGCYTNYAIAADLDGDGFFDLVMANGGDHFFPGPTEPQVVLFGDGAGKFADGAAAFTDGIGKSLVRQVAVADFDGDGRLDVYWPSGYGTTDDQLFMQHAPRQFAKEPSRIPAFARSRAGAVHAADVDNDGDIDLVIADWGEHPVAAGGAAASTVKLHVLENDGHGYFHEKTTIDVPADGMAATDIDLQDINGDFALDIILTNRNGRSRIYFNDGKGTFEDVTQSKAFPPKRGPFTFNAELCDVDGDGDLDLIFDSGARSLAGHATQLLINDGTGKFIDETETRIFGEPRSDDNRIKCVDVDNDGDFDLVVASLSNSSEKLLRNIDGKGHFQLVENAFPRLTDPTLSIDAADFDGDGKVDLLTAQGEVHSQSWVDRIFKNMTATTAVRLPIFRAVEHPAAIHDVAIPLRLAVSDAHTSETGQHVKSVKLEIAIGDHHEELAATFSGGDVFRAVIPPQAAGTVVKVTPHALDRRGGEAIGTPFDIRVADLP